MDNRADNRCTKAYYWNANFMVCMKAKLPHANIGIFETKNMESNVWSPNFNELKHIRFAKESEYLNRDFETSYIAPCKGDSGSGQWITISEDKAQPLKNIKMSQRVLVAVNNVGFHGVFQIGGKTYLGVCGGDVFLDDGSRLVGAPHGTKTTNERILDFLKSSAEI